jgi:uncharacterized protein
MTHPFRPRPAPPSARDVRRALLLFGLIILALVLLPATIRQWTDWLWFRDLGFERVMVTRLVGQLVIGLIAGVAAFVALYASARVSLRGAALDHVLSTPSGARDDLRALTAAVSRLAGAALLPASALMALFVGLGASKAWQSVLAFLHRQPFGVVDPIFERDISYYVFTVPLLEIALGIATLIAMVAALAAAVVYLTRGHLRRAARGLFIDPSAGTHLGAIVAILLLLSAVRIWFVAIPSLLLARHTPLFGASFADLHVSLPIMRGLAVLALLAAIAILWGSMGGRNFALAARALAIYIGASIVGALIPAGYQRIVVQANELSRETPQILHHIQATRQAWGIDSVDRRELQAEARLTPADIAANRVTIDNVRLWDREPLLQTFGQVHSGTASRFSRLSDRSSPSARITTSSRSMTIAIGSAGAFARSCFRPASSTPPRCRRARSSTSTSPTRMAWGSRSDRATR